MKQLSIFIVALFLALSLNTTSMAGFFSAEALATAETFITTIDSGDLQQAYFDSSELLKLRNSEQEWVTEQELIFKLLGTVQERQLMTVRARDSYPGLPDGNYLVVSYECRTQHKAKAIELLLLIEQGEEWRICEYSIR